MSDTQHSSPDNLSDHNYDGIQEYDNPTPLWWELLFFLTIVLAPVYALWFHAPGVGRTLAAQYETDLAANLEDQFGEIGELEPNAETILTYMNDSKWLKVGEVTFAANCVSCHGREGEGISGANLTDDSYIHVKNVEDIARVVAEGAKAGAMPAWATRLHPNQIVLVSSYVAAMRGKNISGKYPIKGNEIPPWPAAPAENDKAEAVDASSTDG